jgi:hypothetical protein
VADDGTPKWKISAYRQDKQGNTEMMRVSVWQQDALNSTSTSKSPLKAS